jgi:hypothetical protein
MMAIIKPDRIEHNDNYSIIVSRLEVMDNYFETEEFIIKDKNIISRLKENNYINHYIETYYDYINGEMLVTSMFLPDLSYKR